MAGPSRQPVSGSLCMILGCWDGSTSRAMSQAEPTASSWCGSHRAAGSRRVPRLCGETRCQAMSQLVSLVLEVFRGGPDCRLETP